MANEPGNTEVSKLTSSNLAKHTNELLRSMARKDSLTGLKNKVALKDDWKKAHSLFQRGELNYKFLFLDLDKFKPINDIDKTHALGDDVLKKVSEALQAMVRPEDSVARVGGDEFAILMQGKDLEVNDKIQAHYEQRFIDKLRETIGEETLSKYPQIKDLGVSIGVVSPETTDTFESIYQTADTVMYSRKAEKGEAR